MRWGFVRWGFVRWGSVCWGFVCWGFGPAFSGLASRSTSGISSRAPDSAASTALSGSWPAA